MMPGSIHEEQETANDIERLIAATPAGYATPRNEPVSDNQQERPYPASSIH